MQKNSIVHCYFNTYTNVNTHKPYCKVFPIFVVAFSNIIIIFLLLASLYASE